MARVVHMKDPGGLETLEVAELSLPTPGPGEIRIRQAAIGVNFIDIYHRIGLYPLPSMPAVLGVEGAGVVTAVGTDVTTVGVGDRIAYACTPGGAYSSERLLPAWRAIPLPSSVTDEVAATAMVRGLTAQMLLTRVHPVGPGTTVLVHAAAGGLGSLLTKWAKRRGATVIGTVGSESKSAIAREAGADHIIVGRETDFAREVTAFTNGRGVDVAYDGIGGTTLLKTLDCVRPFGTVASIGQAGGPIPPLDVSEIGPRRSLSLARPSVLLYTRDPETYRSAAAEVFATLEEGVAPVIGRAYPLVEAAAAQADLEAGRTTGSLYLVP
ncbi:quinone oxidoreductase family protein [Hyalangium versicolor]|uniref:quinone oxidoreductase family protein n=1 Tax=Hyalangium versicolor TaxID=2861190 RepID=UPI001CD02085|nr:quinone oxidoreductase [Hyalangium versicolor]